MLIGDSEPPLPPESRIAQWLGRPGGPYGLLWLIFARILLWWILRGLCESFSIIAKTLLIAREIEVNSNRTEWSSDVIDDNALYALFFFSINLRICVCWYAI
jgi:hypothetical protein